MPKALTLYELNSLVKETIETTMVNDYWVEAELTECRESRGHCYMELVEKDDSSNVPIAKASAKCWRTNWGTIRSYFERVAGQQLHSGMKVMLQVYPQFHELYGFSWIVTDINPEFTLGDMARKRREIVRKLKEEGVFDMQRELTLPVFAQRIAIISSLTAAGYGDFCNQIDNNGYGFRFSTTLFQAVMQGQQVEESIISALNQINERIDDFDVVVIIRGGGGTADFSGFDTLPLAENVANFPLPVITGIGHERDECVLDMVAYASVKTPTAAAAFLIDHLVEVDSFLEKAQDVIVNTVSRKIDYEKVRLEKYSRQIPLLFSIAKTKEEALLDKMSQHILSLFNIKMGAENSNLDKINLRLQNAVKGIIERKENEINQLNTRLQSLNPKRILKYGYSITYKDGHALKDPSVLNTGDEIVTVVEKGKIKSIVR